MYDHVSWNISLDKFQRVTWNFWLYNQTLVLDSYKVEVRETTRHNYKVTEAYHRLSNSTNEYGAKHLTEAEVPLTADVMEEAISRFTSKLRVVRWSEIEKGR